MIVAGMLLAQSWVGEARGQTGLRPAVGRHSRKAVESPSHWHILSICHFLPICCLRQLHNYTLLMNQPNHFQDSNEPWPLSWWLLCSPWLGVVGVFCFEFFTNGTNDSRKLKVNGGSQFGNLCLAVWQALCRGEGSPVVYKEGGGGGDPGCQDAGGVQEHSPSSWAGHTHTDRIQ